MNFIRFQQDELPGFGTLDEHGTIHEFHGEMYWNPIPTGRSIPLNAVTLLPPSATGTMIALWNNSRPQIDKLGRSTPREALWFIKPASSFATHRDPIVYPSSETSRVVLEGELGIVIGQPCRRVRPQDAAACIFGYTLVNDVTAQDLVGRDPSFPQYTRAKGFDTFGLFGPVVATDLDPMSLRVQSFINGRECQNYGVTDLVFNPFEIVAEVSRTVTLQVGTVIACGTSLGAEEIRPGDEVEIRINGIGSLINRVQEG